MTETDSHRMNNPTISGFSWTALEQDRANQRAAAAAENEAAKTDRSTAIDLLRKQRREAGGALTRDAEFLQGVRAEQAASVDVARAAGGAARVAAVNADATEMHRQTSALHSEWWQQGIIESADRAEAQRAQRLSRQRLLLGQTD